MGEVGFAGRGGGGVSMEGGFNLGGGGRWVPLYVVDACVGGSHVGGWSGGGVEVVQVWWWWC